MKRLQKICLVVSALCSGLLGVESADAQDVETVSVECEFSKNIQLRIGNTGQSPTGASFEMRESAASGDDGAMDYGFCGLMGFDLAPLYARMNLGYRLKGVKLQLTNASNNTSAIRVLPFGHEEWEANGKTATYDLLKDKIMAAVGQTPLIEDRSNCSYGKKPFELQNKANVEVYDITKYQKDFETTAFTEYVMDAVRNHAEGVSFLFVNPSNTTNAVMFFLKDAVSKSYGTSTTDKWVWNPESGAWEKTEPVESATRYEMMLSYFGLSESQFRQAVAPKLIFEFERMDVSVAMGKPMDLDVTDANTVRTSNAGTKVLTLADGTKTGNVYCSNQSNGILYAGRYDFSKVKGFRANVTFEQSSNRAVSLRLIAMDCLTDGAEMTTAYMDTNSGTIRNGTYFLCSLRGTQEVSSDANWHKDKRGTYYYVDLENRTVFMDDAEYLKYWGKEGLSVTDMSIRTDNKTLAGCEFGPRCDAALQSTSLQDVFMYADAQFGRVTVSSLTLYYKDDSMVTLPVRAMNGVELGGDRSLSPAIIKASTTMLGGAITDVALGEVDLTEEVAGALAEVQDGGVTAMAAAKLSYDMNVSSAGVSTLVLPYDAALPEGVKAYTLSYVSGDKAQATEVTTLTANEPVLVNAEAGPYAIAAENVSIGNLAGNQTKGALVGAYAEGTVPEGAYVLQNQADGLAFYKVAPSSVFKSKPFRAYLTAEASGVNRLSIDFGDVDGIRETVVETRDSEAVYTLQGVKVADSPAHLNALPKGVYIVGGKKFAVK